MNQHEQDPLEALRAANPVSDQELPSASLARLRARVYEETMGVGTGPTARTRRFGRAGPGLVAVATLAIVLVLGANAGAWLRPGDTSGPGTAMCVEQYSLETLGRRAFAFEGTVTAIVGERVTFAIGAPYRGVDSAVVTLDAPGMTGTAITSAGGPNLSVGGRYLVAGEATFAWACGFTQPYDAAVAATWAAALGG